MEFEFVVEMNLVQIGASPNLFVSLQTKGTYSPARTATRNWGDAIKVQSHLRNMSFTRRFFPTGTRDGGRREPCEPQPCSLGEKVCLSWSCSRGNTAARSGIPGPRLKCGHPWL